MNAIQTMTAQETVDFLLGSFKRFQLFNKFFDTFYSAKWAPEDLPKLDRFIKTQMHEFDQKQIDMLIDRAQLSKAMICELMPKASGEAIFKAIQSGKIGIEIINGTIPLDPIQEMSPDETLDFMWETIRLKCDIYKTIIEIIISSTWSAEDRMQYGRFIKANANKFAKDEIIDLIYWKTLSKEILYDLLPKLSDYDIRKAIKAGKLSHDEAGQFLQS